MTRRRLLHWLMGLGSGSALVAMLSAVNSLKPLVVKSTRAVAEGDVLIFALGPSKGQAITKEGLDVGQAVLATVKGKEDDEANTVLVVRLSTDELEPPTRIEWTADGVVAYSAICTHLGCTVLSELRSDAIYCPCHAGVYDPRRGAIVVSGPPPRPLPQLPIRLDAEGKIVVAGEFTEPIGTI